MSSISSTEYNEYSLDAAVELELSVVGLGSGRCSSSCRASKRPIRLENGSSSMSERESALVVIELIMYSLVAIRNLSANVYVIKKPIGSCAFTLVNRLLELNTSDI